MRSLSLLLILLCAVSLMLGSKQTSLIALFNFSNDAWLTLTASRIPRLIALVLTGVGLSVSGVILQHIVRNKFVEPATSGVWMLPNLAFWSRSPCFLMPVRVVK